MEKQHNRMNYFSIRDHVDWYSDNFAFVFQFCAKYFYMCFHIFDSRLLFLIRDRNTCNGKLIPYHRESVCMFVVVCESEGQGCWSHKLFSSWCEHVLRPQARLDPKAASIQPCHHGLSSEHCSFHISFLCCPRASSFYSWCSNPQDTWINHLHYHLKLQCAISEENVSELRV